MFDLYTAPDQATYRQAEAYDEVAADRLARAAASVPSEETTAAVDAPSSAHAIIARIIDGLGAITGGSTTAGHRPSRV